MESAPSVHHARLRSSVPLRQVKFWKNRCHEKVAETPGSCSDSSIHMIGYYGSAKVELPGGVASAAQSKSPEDNTQNVLSFIDPFLFLLRSPLR